ncbi:MAG: plasmid pRiA4b ORF-3 family protein [Parcubacteria group bacterium Gr01-1014_33]|nr:MAG: plasmid pRiA4b ORF-3 family protein [Parcubacteria group bacterium Gr01-1014_33]
MHTFRKGEIQYIIPYPDDDYGFGPKPKDERGVTLSEIISQPKERMIYDYDFGDDWHNDVVLEKILKPEKGVKYPACTGGKLSGPPEDVGGLWEYYEFLEAIKNPKHPDHKDMREWIGGEFDPEEFDMEATNADLKKMRI